LYEYAAEKEKVVLTVRQHVYDTAMCIVQRSNRLLIAKKQTSKLIKISKKLQHNKSKGPDTRLRNKRHKIGTLSAGLASEGAEDTL
jgi:hypothetical protein